MKRKFSCSRCTRSATFVLYNEELVCTACAQECGFDIELNITSYKLREIHTKVSAVVGSKVPAVAFGVMLGMQVEPNVMQVYVSQMESGKRPIPLKVAEAALMLEAASAEELTAALKKAQKKTARASR